MLTKQKQAIEEMVEGEYVEYDPFEGTLIWKRIDSKYHQRYVGTSAYYTTKHDHVKDIKLVTKHNGIRVSTLNLIYYIVTHLHMIKPHILRPIDGNKLNLKLENLEILDKHQQMAVSVKKSRGKCVNSSGVRGVSWDKGRCKWRADIRFEYRQHFLGRFELFDDACDAVDKAHELCGYSDRELNTNA